MVENIFILHDSRYICEKLPHMQKYILLTFILFGWIATQAQVGIGTTAPDSSAILDVTSDDKGILIPRMPTANRAAMANVQGMLVYDTDINSFIYNDGTQWVVLVSSISNSNLMQAGTYNVGSLVSGWQYYDISFHTPFTQAPSIVISFREGVGVNNTGSNSIEQIKVANASTTGFTIGVNDSSSTNDVFIDWIATEKTQ